MVRIVEADIVRANDLIAQYKAVIVKCYAALKLCRWDLKIREEGRMLATEAILASERVIPWEELNF